MAKYLGIEKIWQKLVPIIAYVHDFLASNLVQQTLENAQEYFVAVSIELIGFV